MLPKALPTVLGAGIGAAGPVVLHVGVAFTDDPIGGATYEPTDGATLDPYPDSPACANANVLVSVNADASAIVVSFMVLSFVVKDKRQPRRLFNRSIKPSLARSKPREVVPMSQSLKAPSLACWSSWP